MNKYNLNQTSFFGPDKAIIFSDKPCILCGSLEQVLAVLFKSPTEKFNKLAYLCVKCRSNPAIMKG